MTQKDKQFYTLVSSDVLNNLHTTEKGLTEEEVQKRIQTYGPNQMVEGKKQTLLQKFIEQFKNLMIIILLIAALISGLTHEITDSIIILVVVFLNAILGVVQENRAEKALEALKQMSSPHAKVRRNGNVEQVESSSLVPGDIVLLDAGDLVPADLRLLECSSLKVEEAALTGESLPVEKFTDRIDQLNLVIGDRKNMAFAGSSVSYGRGLGVVTATGMSTEVGKIAEHLASNPNQSTPLQIKLAELSKYLTIAVLVISLIIFVTGVYQGRDYLDMLLTSISLAVAAIPEGLPAVITIVLALGVQKMASKNAIIRKLSAVETLGSTEIICSDKTGTLTQNRMTVQEVFIDGSIEKREQYDPKIGGSKELFVNALILCNDSKLSKAEDQTISFIGDPTETALTMFAMDRGVDIEEVQAKLPRMNEIPFDSERKLMTTVHHDSNGYLIMTKGAPDMLLTRCTHHLVGEEVESLNELTDAKIRSANKQMADRALRVLAVAYRRMNVLPDTLTSEEVENQLIFVGLVGMIDPPRDEAKKAVEKCIGAGIRTIMITGDHKDTALAIAKQLHIYQEGDIAVTGSELDQMSEQELASQIERCSVYARVSPEHKVRIVKAWKRRGKVIAMTGDGVNDAPALKASDIGIGMGITGTDVAKGASNMVLADDNFATIVVAVEEGRKIYRNIQKSIQFLLSSNLGEIITLFVGTLLGWTVLFPIHILWINLVTDTLPARALGLEKEEKGIMKQKPRKANSSFFSDGVGGSIIYQGILQGLLTLLSYYLGLRFYSVEIAVTMAFATLGFIQLFHSLNIRSNRQSLFSIGFFKNKLLIGAICISAFLQSIVILIPGLNPIFKVSHLNLQQWGIVLLISFSIIPIIEIIKLFYKPSMETAKPSE